MPTEIQAKQIVRSLIEGKSEAQALLGAGYSEGTAYHNASKVLNTEKVLAELRRAGEKILPEELGAVAKARLMEALGTDNISWRDRIQSIRLAAEMAGHISSGGKFTEHLHHHEINLSPETRRLLALEMAELQQLRASAGNTIEVEANAISGTVGKASHQAGDAPV